MSEKIEYEDDRIRLRLTIQPILNDRLVRFADALGVDRNQAAVFALSMGLHALSMGVNPPMEKINAIMRAEAQERMLPGLDEERPPRQW